MVSPQRSVPRQSAPERRVAIVESAVEEFARHGYSGASVEAIARGVGISQPYIFRLFGTKKELFLAVTDHVYDTLIQRFVQAADAASGRGVPALQAMAEAYDLRLRHRNELLLLLQSFAASGDTEIQAHTRANYRRVIAEVARRTGVGHAELQAFFANGMLLTISAALDLPDLFDCLPAQE